MTVYVDDAQHPYRHMKMCHMVADTLDELLLMADRIGVQRKWLQSPNTHQAHFDICQSKRRTAVEAGAVEITQRQLGRMLKNRRETGSLGTPHST